MKSNIVRVLTLALAALLPSYCWAQTAETSLHGTVYDPQGAVIPAATVTIVQPDTGFMQEHPSGSHGEFTFPQIPPGHYTITVSAPGFAAKSQTAELLVNQPATTNFNMSITADTTVEVDSTVAALNSVDATIGTPFNTTQIQSLPFEGTNIMDLLSLQAGVVFTGDVNQNSNTDTRAGSVNGARSDQNNITLDGLDNNVATKGFAFQGALRATRDSLEEFRVVTTNSNADSGRSSGAQVSLVTRSGTNKVHGSVYYYYRPTDTVANDWFNKKKQATAGTPNIPPKYLRNVFGASLGMPIVRDKLFFFGAYEGAKIAEDKVVTQVVPTASLAAGTVKYTNTAGTVTTLTAANIASMDPFCSGNGTCPLGPGPNPAVLAYFAKYPAANSTTVGDGLNTSGYTFTSPNPVSNFTTIVKFDYNLSSSHRLFIRGNLQQDNTATTIQFPGSVPGTRTFDNTRGIAAGDVWTISPRMVNNLRYGLTRPGAASRGNITSQYVSFASIAALASNSTSSVSIVSTHNIVDDFTWTKGKHNIQVGGNYRAIFDDHSSNNTIYNNAGIGTGNLVKGGIANTGTSLDPGAFGFAPVASGSKATYNSAIANVTGLITMATGYANYSISNGTLTPLAAGVVPTRHFFSNEAEYYLQDTWKATPKLTLTFGIRHTLLQVPYERNSQQVVPTFSLNNWFAQRALAASQGGVNQPNISFTQGGQASGRQAYWQMDKADIAPRFAFSYAVNPSMTIRGGYGLYYDHFGNATVDALDQRGSFGLASTLSNGASQFVDTAPRFSSLTAVPASLIPAISNPGTFPVTPPTGAGLTAWVLDDKMKTPYAHVVDFSIQQQMTHNIVFELDYTGRLGRRLMQQLDLAEPLNVVDPKSGVDYYTAGTQLSKYVDQGITGAQAASIPTIPYFDNMFPLAATPGLTPTQSIYKNKWINDRGNETEAIFELDTPAGGAPSTYPQYRFFNQQYVNLVGFTSIGTSSYHSLQASLHHPMANGVQYDINYTFSKSLDIGSDGERVAPANSRGYSQIIDSFNPKLNKSASDFDVRHNLSINALVPLPFGRGQRFLPQANHVVDEVIGHWVVTGLAHITSGLPWGAIDGAGWTTNFDVRSWMVATGYIQSGGHGMNSLQNPNVFGANAAGARLKMRYPYPGEAGERNYFRGDGYYSLDMGVDKVFPITDHQQVKFAAEAFNVTNSNSFDPKSIQNNWNTAATFGNYTTLLTQNRRMQFSLRYSF